MYWKPVLRVAFAPPVKFGPSMIHGRKLHDSTACVRKTIESTKLVNLSIISLLSFIFNIISHFLTFEAIDTI